MLSRELTKRKDKTHLQSFLDRINAPHTLPKGEEQRKFRALVTERLEQRRALKDKELASEKSISSGLSSFIKPPSVVYLCITCRRSDTSCCIPWCAGRCGKHGARADPEIVWRRMECKTFENFESYSAAAITSNLNIIRCLRAITQSMTFWEEPRPDWEGFSVLGCYGWILSFTLQHLMDEDDPKDITLLTGLDEIRQIYTEIAQSAEIFVDMVEKFYEHSHRLRSDMLFTVKKLVKKWRLESSSPLLHRPEKSLLSSSLGSGRGGGRHVSNSMMDYEADSAFHLNWTPLAVMIKSKKMSVPYQEFGGLILPEKLHWFKVFANHVVDMVELEAEDMHVVAGQLSCIHISNVTLTSHTVKSHARELSGALVHFSKIAKSNPTPTTGSSSAGGDESQSQYLVRLLSDLWFSADILYEEATRLVRIVRETRDILRTCYVYADIFYKLGLPSYDDFLVQQGQISATRPGRNSNRPQQHNASTVKTAWDKFIGGDGRKLSDLAEMLVMADFSTSPYQQILQVRPVEAENMVMKLESQSMSDPNLPYGLVNKPSLKKLDSHHKP